MLQRVLIDVDLLHDDALIAERIDDRHRRLTSHSDADGVGLDAQGARRLGSWA